MKNNPIFLFKKIIVFQMLAGHKRPSCGPRVWDRCFTTTRWIAQNLIKYSKMLHNATRLKTNFFVLISLNSRQSVSYLFWQNYKTRYIKSPNIAAKLKLIERTGFKRRSLSPTLKISVHNLLMKFRKKMVPFSTTWLLIENQVLKY